jgi:hypothetical protein
MVCSFNKFSRNVERWLSALIVEYDQCSADPAVARFIDHARVDELPDAARRWCKLTNDE